MRHDNQTARNVVVETKLANAPVSRFQLFHLVEDPAEQHNIIDEHPEVAERLKPQLAKIIDAGRTRRPTHHFLSGRVERQRGEESGERGYRTRE